jgi:phage shock protein A
MGYSRALRYAAAIALALTGCNQPLSNSQREEIQSLVDDAPADDGRLSELQAELDDLRSEIETLRSDADDLEADHATLKGRVGDLEMRAPY